MTDFDAKSRERLVRVEQGVIHITELLKDHIDEPPCAQLGCSIMDDIVDLRGTQKWIKWASKTVIGGAILGCIGYLVR